MAAVKKKELAALVRLIFPGSREKKKKIGQHFNQFNTFCFLHGLRSAVAQ